MITGIKIALAAALVALAVSVTAATAADELHVTEAGGAAFPQRTWVLSLPSGQRLKSSSVDVEENGHGVIDLTVHPSGTTAGSTATGTVLVIDASKSMAGAPIKSALEAARAFADRRNVNQQLALETFNSSATVPLGFTSSQDSINEALAKAPALKFQTHLYDAIAQAVALARTQGLATGSVIVLSDGADVGSGNTLEQVVESAKAAHMRIFTVGLKTKTFRPEALQQLATATGGTFSAADSPTDLGKIYDTLGLQLAQEYILEYQSKVKPGRSVKVDVAVQGVGTTEAAYVAPTVAGSNAVYHHAKIDDVWQSTWTMLALALIIPLMLAAAILVPLSQRGSTVRSRVSDYVSMPEQQQDEAFVSRVFTGTERSLEKSRWWQRFKDALRFADVPIPPVYLALGTVIATLLAVWILAQIAGPLAVFGLLLPLVVRGVIMSRAARKRRMFADQLADNLDVLASGLRAGHSLVGALAVVVGDAAEPSKTEFQGVIADEQLGVPLDVALQRVVERMRSRDLEQVALVAAVQSETGGNAAEVLDRVTESIRERQELRRLIRTLTAQGRLARWIVSLLPVILLIAIEILNPDYMKPMFHNTGGIVALVVGALMIIAGSVAIGRIVEIDV